MMFRNRSQHSLKVCETARRLQLLADKIQQQGEGVVPATSQLDTRPLEGRIDDLQKEIATLTQGVRDSGETARRLQPLADEIQRALGDPPVSSNPPQTSLLFIRPLPRQLTALIDQAGKSGSFEPWTHSHIQEKRKELVSVVNHLSGPQRASTGCDQRGDRKSQLDS